MSSFKTGLTNTIEMIQAHGLMDTLKAWLTLDQAKVGTLMGMDSHGNKYYENKQDLAGRSRWVIYKKWNYDATQIPPEWHQWMHRITDTVPTERVKPVFEPEHKENLTGTKMAYRPYSTTRPKIHEWEPQIIK